MILRSERPVSNHNSKNHRQDVARGDASVSGRLCRLSAYSSRPRQQLLRDRGVRIDQISRYPDLDSLPQQIQARFVKQGAMDIRAKPGFATDHFAVSELVVAQMAGIGQVDVDLDFKLSARHGKRLINARGTPRGRSWFLVRNELPAGAE